MRHSSFGAHCSNRINMHIHNNVYKFDGSFARTHRLNFLSKTFQFFPFRVLKNFIRSFCQSTVVGMQVFVCVCAIPMMNSLRVFFAFVSCYFSFCRKQNDINQTHREKNSCTQRKLIIVYARNEMSYSENFNFSQSLKIPSSFPIRLQFELKLKKFIRGQIRELSCTQRIQ